MNPQALKRLFFAIDVHAPWPEKLPSGRILEESNRHLTLAFLGEADYEKLNKKLSTLPPLSFKVALAGQFDACLFLPFRDPHVVAWHIDWFEENMPLLQFQQELLNWLKENDFKVDEHHSFNPHVTLARSPFQQDAWKKAFIPLPLYVQNLHLFESLGHSRYTSLWTQPLLPPFEEIEHTADIAFRIYAGCVTRLFTHAQIALSFVFPQILPFLIKNETLNSIEEIVIALNHIVSIADQEIGAPFKAVSFHGEIEQKTDGTFMWEMIIDV